MSQSTVVVLLICLSLQVQSRHHELPIRDNLVMESSFKHGTDQMELLHTLRADGLVDKVVITHGNERKDPFRRRTNDISIYPREIEEEKMVKNIIFEAIKASESNSRRSRTVTKRSDNKLVNQITKERLLSVMARVNKQPNKSSPLEKLTGRETIADLKEKITNLVRKITLNDNFLPGKLQPNGQKCIEKVLFVNETRFDHGKNCEHKLSKECHLTYVTDYHSSPEEKCSTEYDKNCFIVFKPVPHTEKVKKCYIPYETKCNQGNDGPKVCKTVHETTCETSYKEYEITEDEPNCKMVEELRCVKVPLDILHLPHKDDNEKRLFAQKERCEKWPVQKCSLERKRSKKIHPNTECKKIPREICAPSNCRTLPGPEVCKEEKRVVVQNVPEEECSLQPQENCRTESTLVPRLVPKKNCVQVPKEICYDTKSNPKKVMRPIFSNWCYSPRDLKDILNQ